MTLDTTRDTTWDTTRDTTWVLLPGAWARGPEVLGRVQAALGRAARAIVVDLPKLDPAQASLEHYAATIREQVRAQAPTENTVTLMAHSAGGGLVPAAVDALTDAAISVNTVVLVTAFVPVQGSSVIALRPSMDDTMRAQVRARMASLPPEQRVLPVPTGAQLDDLYLAALPQEEAEQIRAALVPEPFAVLDAGVDYGQLAGRCPVHYIFCDQDQALPLEVQQRMLKGLRDAGCQGQERSLEAGHNVILTHGQELAALLLALAPGQEPPTEGGLSAEQPLPEAVAVTASAVTASAVTASTEPAGTTGPAQAGPTQAARRRRWPWGRRRSV